VSNPEKANRSRHSEAAFEKNMISEAGRMKLGMV
jgi:hypothetical protein